MEILPWKDDFSIGVKSIDDEHRILVTMINKAHDAVDNETGGRAVEDLVLAMMQYARDHFATEEKLMEKHAYPGLEDHKSEHWEFIARICQKQPFKDGLILPGEVKALSFLADWLVKHIMGTDREMGEFLKGKGVE